MQVLVLTERDDFDAALAVARAIGKGGEVTGLAAPLGAALRGRLADAWNHIEAALEQAWNRGRSFARDVAEMTAVKVQEIVDAADAQARELHHSILAKLNGYLAELIDRALARVRAVITVADHTLELDRVDIEQKLTLSGSLTASIQEICALTAEGEISVTAGYSR